MRDWINLQGTFPPLDSKHKNIFTDILQILAPYTKQIIGMDISEGMVEQFNRKVSTQNPYQSHTRK